MLNHVSRALIAFTFLTASAAQGAEVAPLPPIVPDEVEKRDVAELDARAAKGDLKAMAELGARYARGAGVTVDLPKAISLFERAANKNEANAAYYLGTAYYGGLGVKNDPKKAAHWFGNAAEQGHAGAQYSLGVMMAAGQGGLKADPSRAAAYILKSAEQGYFPAAFRMAQLHIAGLGAARDTEQAAHWYRRVLKTGEHQPSAVGLITLIETKEAKWQPGDPGAPPAPVENATAERQGIVASAAPASPAPTPKRAPRPQLPEQEVATSFKTEQGPIIDAHTRAGGLTLYSTSDKPYNCEILVKFTYLDADSARQTGEFACFRVAGKAGEKIKICEVANSNFVQTKVENVQLTKCREPGPK